MKEDRDFLCQIILYRLEIYLKVDNRHTYC